MTAGDARLDAIQARLDGAEPGPWFLDADGVSIYYVFHNGDTLDRDRLAQSSGHDAEFIANAPADVAFLLAELREAREALGRVDTLANYLDVLAPGDQHYAKLIRAAVAAANGDGRG